MMEVHEVIEYYNQNGLNETLDYFDIDIIHKELRGKTVESRLVIDFYGKATIFIQPDLNENYEFVLQLTPCYDKTIKTVPVKKPAAWPAAFTHR